MMTGKWLRIFTLGAALGLAQPAAGLAATREEIDADVQEAIETFYKQSSAGHRLAQKAAGMLVFPKVIFSNKG